MVLSHLPTINPNYACCPRLNINSVSFSLKKYFSLNDNFTTILPMNNPSLDKQRSSFFGVWHQNVACELCISLKIKDWCRHQEESAESLAAYTLIELGKTDQFKITSLSVKTAGWSIPNTTYLSEQTLSTHLFLHIVFSTCSRLLTWTAINNNSKKQWELMTSFIPSV